MDIKSILDSLQGCPCGRPHNFDTERVEIGRGLVHRTGDILAESNFPKNVLLVADDNTLGVSEGLLASLKKNGFHVKKLIYDDMKYARAEQVEEIENLAADCDGIISVGTGSLNDICRVASFRKEKDGYELVLHNFSEHENDAVVEIPALDKRLELKFGKYELKFVNI